MTKICTVFKPDYIDPNVNVKLRQEQREERHGRHLGAFRVSPLFCGKI
jgi:hypothetical protein